MRVFFSMFACRFLVYKSNDFFFIIDSVDYFIETRISSLLEKLKGNLTEACSPTLGAKLCPIWVGWFTKIYTPRETLESVEHLSAFVISRALNSKPPQFREAGSRKSHLKIFVANRQTIIFFNLSHTIAK